MRSATGAGDPFASSSLCLCRWAKRNSVRFRDSARARTDGANHRREKGEEHHHGNHPVDTLADVRNRLAHEIPTQDQTRAPANSAHDIKRQVTAITHLRGALSAPIPAFLISGNTNAAPLREASASGYALLHKPVDSTALHAKLTQMLKSQQAGLNY